MDTIGRETAHPGTASGWDEGVQVSGRVVVVTGAAGGIGSAIVERARRSATRWSDSTSAPRPTARPSTRSTSPIRRAASGRWQRIVDEHGGIDVLCNNAGIAAVGDVVQSTPDDWQRVFAVNVFGVANMSRAVLPHMRELAAARW
jgi:2-keto-3-deoxy-L-fuconate dehydrogenase